MNQSYSPLQSSLSSTGQSTHTLCVSPLERKKKKKNEKNRRTISFFFMTTATALLMNVGNSSPFFFFFPSIFFFFSYIFSLFLHCPSSASLNKHTRLSRSNWVRHWCALLCSVFPSKRFLWCLYTLRFGWRLGSIRCWTTHTQHIVLPYTTTSWLL